MSELEKIVYTSAFTVLGGALVYVFGQVVSKFYIDPVYELRKTIGEVADSLFYYANYYSNPGTGLEEKIHEASIVLRQRASQLSAKSHAINGYWLFYILGYLPSKNNVKEASRELTGLSNSVHEGKGRENYEQKKRILNLLKLS